MKSIKVDINRIKKCQECKHTNVHPQIYPCNECVRNVIPKDHFEPRKMKEGGYHKKNT